MEDKDGRKLTIRKLTERECMRLQAFTDEEIDRLYGSDAKGKREFARTAIYRFAGNSICVEPLKFVMRGCTRLLDGKVRVGGLFTGVGAHHSAMDRLRTEDGTEYEVAFQCEIDAKTVTAYNRLHDCDVPNLGDVTQVHALSDDLKVDILMVSPPCQDISVAGRQAGLGEGTRSGLIYEIPRIISETPMEDRPSFVVWEDVPALVSKKYVGEWNAILETMDGLGYRTVWKVLNAADYGVAQSRKRVFAVSRLGAEPPAMPEPFPLEKRLKDYLEPEPVADCYYLSEERLKGLIWSNEKEKESERGFRFAPNHYPYDVIAHTLTLRCGGGRKTENYLVTEGKWPDEW